MYNLQKDIEQATMDAAYTAFENARREWIDFQTPAAMRKVLVQGQRWELACLRHQTLCSLEEVDPAYIETLNHIEQELQNEQHQAQEDAQ